MFLAFMLCNFSVRMLKYSLKRFKKNFAHKKLKKPPQKVAYLWQLGGFFSATLTAQNSPEFHFRFINSFIQSSLLGLRVQTFPSPQVHLYYHALKSNFHKFAQEYVFTKNRSRRSLFWSHMRFFGRPKVSINQEFTDFINLSKLSFYLIR